MMSAPAEQPGPTTDGHDVEHHSGPAGTARRATGGRVLDLDLEPVLSGRQHTPEVTAADRRIQEVADLWRAIGAGEIDSLIVSDGGQGRRTYRLTTADEPYRMFVENMREGAATVSAAGLILYANRRLTELLELTAGQIVGAPITDFVIGGSSHHLQRLQTGEGTDTTMELELRTAQGNVVPVLVGMSPLTSADGMLSCLTFTDLSAQKRQEAEIARLGVAQSERLAQLQEAQSALTRQATHDALTGLPNRALLVDRIEQGLAQARRSGHWTAVFFIDLDSFKRVNDTHGHAVGDEVLIATAQRLSGVIRTMDTASRIGGDEFAVLACEVDSEMHAVDIGSRLVDGISRSRLHAVTAEYSEAVTVSVGIAVSTAGAGSAESLLDEADAAMYQAKALGGNRAAIFDAALSRQAQERMATHRMLQAALEERRIVPFFQPILDLTDGRIVGFEALARLREPGGSMVAPGVFIPVAEDSGLIVPLDTEVLRMACREAQRWPAGSGPPLTVAVNLSGRQFDSGDLVDTVRSALEENGLHPSQLHIELTETATIDLRPDVLQQLGDLRAMGVEIGLDDFGTGYGSLTHLRRLPLTFVKIDQTFVQGLGTDGGGDERIVVAVIHLAADLGLRSIGEGVETAEQLQILRRLGCDQAQGYLFARPLPYEDIDAALARPRWSADG